ncbi:MAG: GNAT family N-acetyltransferase [Pseudomonadota bacterium]
MIRPATPADAADIADIHVQAWDETYTDLVPPDEIAARDFPFRLHQWTTTLAAADTRTAFLPGLGFAQTGPQRLPHLAETHPDELYCLYLLRQGQGRGHARALLDAVRSDRAMTALVLAGNTRASAFYAAAGAVLIDTQPCRVGDTDTEEYVYAWPATA